MVVELVGKILGAVHKGMLQAGVLKQFTDINDNSIFSLS